MRFITMTVAGLVLSGLGTSFAHAGVTATAQQVGSNLVFSTSGTLDVSGLTPFFANTVTASPLLSPTSIVRFFAGAPVTARNAFTYASLGSTPETQINGPASFGSSAQVTASSGTGAFAGFELAVAYGPTAGGGGITVPTGYVSGTPLVGTATYNNKTLTTLGISPGVYTWTWPTATGTRDFYTLVVPEPTSLSALALSAVMLRRRRSR